MHLYPAGQIRRNLRKARLNANIWTQKELAVRTGIAPSIISDLERGRRAMSPQWAVKIAEVVGVNYGTLMTEYTEPMREE
ncbi:MAG: helix-turn-helix transcriptional regulator [Desulfitobacteriaceae bacterium]|nr:helix-turn-helix transcriptional regulator [Desulfitobacteriaceae bacterium]MDI6915545.1 helix-turn-helix transcriptional regulator [Desulfitobacteriaceae bacterium]